MAKAPNNSATRSTQGLQTALAGFAGVAARTVAVVAAVAAATAAAVLLLPLPLVGRSLRVTRGDLETATHTNQLLTCATSTVEEQAKPHRMRPKGQSTECRTYSGEFYIGNVKQSIKANLIRHRLLKKCMLHSYQNNKFLKLSFPGRRTNF